MEREIRLALVVAEFNSEMTDKMLEQALKRAAEHRALVTYVCKVPGSYDMPLIIQLLLEKDDVDAVVTLGAVVKGETKHDEVIAHTLASKAADLSLRHKKPVALGVSGPSMTWEQGTARIEEFANRSVDSAINMVLRQRQIEKSAGDSSYPRVIE